MKIKEEFRSLIPPLTPDEFSQLEANCLAEGIRDAILTWNDYIIDGHNRYEIAQKHNLPFKTQAKEFESEDDVIIWMCNNQLGRRNLPEFVKYELESRKKEALLRKGKEEYEKKSVFKGNQHTAPLSTIDNEPKHNTQKAIADKLGWSTGKVAMAEVVAKKAPEEVKQKLRANEMSINEAYQKVKKDIRSFEIQEQRRELAEKGKNTQGSNFRIFHDDIRKWKADKQYDWIITDPPYPKEFLPLWEVLAERSNEWLKDGGLLVAMSGQMYLEQIYEMLSKHLTYYWTACYLTPGQPTPLRHVNVNTTWKPLLIFGKGKYKGKIFGDVFKSDGNDKDHHKWGQSISGMDSIITGLCLSGESILDPFCGAGTTGISAIKHGCLFDGVELEKENVNISKARINDAKKE
jgi:16S rRNA G966 N2-methylase RsmD